MPACLSFLFMPVHVLGHLLPSDNNDVTATTLPQKVCVCVRVQCVCVWAAKAQKGYKYRPCHVVCVYVLQCVNVCKEKGKEVHAMLCLCLLYKERRPAYHDGSLHRQPSFYFPTFAFIFFKGHNGKDHHHHQTPSTTPNNFQY